MKERDYTLSESSINDWLQANWELLVERKVLKIDDYLEIYGDGADFNGQSSRIIDPNELADFRVIVQSRFELPIFDYLNDEEVNIIKMTFNKLVGFVEGFYVLEPLFKYVLLKDEVVKLERVLDLNDVRFELVKI